MKMYLYNGHNADVYFYFFHSTLFVRTQLL